jgi:uncharacterized protein YabE (DUF348 family)
MVINLTKFMKCLKIASQSLINILTGGFVLLPLGKNIKRLFSSREVIIAVLAVTISITAGAGVFFYLKKEVVINDEGQHIVAKTMKSTVGEALEQNGITVESYDYISMPLDAKLQRIKTNEINIKRAVPVSILADGTEYPMMTYRDTVAELLADSGVKPEGLDRLVGVKPEDAIRENMSIRIVRVDEEVVSEKEPIPFQKVKRENGRLDTGVERVVKKGQDGVREKQYKVVTEDGKEVSKQLVSDSVLLAPITMITEYGTVLNHKTSRGDVLRYRKVLDMRATAYTASYKDTGKRPGDPGFGITRTGVRAKKGIIAVDPKVIPLGTRVYVEVAGKTPDYGFAVAADTGGAIKGNLIDLYYDEQSTADGWGVKRVKVYILLD